MLLVAYVLHSHEAHVDFNSADVRFLKLHICRHIPLQVRRYLHMDNLATEAWSAAHKTEVFMISLFYAANHRERLRQTSFKDIPIISDCMSASQRTTFAKFSAPYSFLAESFYGLHLRVCRRFLGKTNRKVRLSAA